MMEIGMKIIHVLKWVLLVISIAGIITGAIHGKHDLLAVSCIGIFYTIFMFLYARFEKVT